MSVATAVLEPPGRGGGLQVGRMLVTPAYDYLLIGGALSVVATLFLRWGGLVSRDAVLASWGVFQGWLPLLLLVCNGAHLGASTVRLYTKPGDYPQRRFLMLSLPLITVLVMTLGVVFSGSVGRQVYTFYLTFTPYHYSSQAYGLAMLYCYRSRCAVDDTDRLALRLATLAPFLYSFLLSPGMGIAWLLPSSWLELQAVAGAREMLGSAAAVLSFAAPAAWLGRLVWRRQAVPAVSVLIVFSNALWWIVLTYVGAFVVATIFHAVQYLAIITIFHARERSGEAPNARRMLYHAGAFYLMCVALAYLLVNVWPWAYVQLGFSLAEAVLMSVGVLSIHHFLVDAYIWRLRKDNNYQVVMQGAS